jgi:hypothetical protein
MTSIELPDLKHSIQDLRQNLDGLYSFIEHAESSIKEMDQIALQAQQTAERVLSFNETILLLQKNLECVIQPIDDASTVMQRELTHLEKIGEAGLARQPDITVRAVSSLLQLSLTIATRLFSPEQLDVFSKAQNSYEMDRLRQRWKEWLGELTNYLTQVLTLVQALAEKDDVGTMGNDYVQSVDKLARQCRQWQVYYSKKVSNSVVQPINEFPTDIDENSSEGSPKN